MKKYLLFATAALALASCTNESYLGTAEELATTKGEQPISFGFDVPTPTRAEGAAAADKLNSQFIVWGEKNESGASEATVASGNRVFPNYKVTYGANTAYTSTSNTKDWEYVGLAYGDEKANVKIGGTAVTNDVQTIKYWDYNATNYVFTAVSAKPDDISGGKVIINKIAAGTTNEYDKGYQVTVTDMADLTSLYFSDRVKIGDETGDKTGYDRTAVNKYGGNVTFTFRNGLSQVRVGMYEVIPGYDVKVTKFYYVDAANPEFSAMTSESTTNFVANVPNVSPATGKTSVAGTFTVKYYAKNATNDAAGISNHPTITFAPTSSSDSKKYITLGDRITAATKLGETSTAATFDKADGSDADDLPDYTTVFPQETNSQNLKLKIDYQLKNTVTGETINISGKTAEIPAQYLQWKPNFKYTYLFKINDNDLYPITFDAVVIEAENGEVEYITTVSEPSITTFGVKGGKYSVGNAEYETGTAVYATVEQGSALQTLSASNMQLYTVTSADAEANFKITEASVAEALIEGPTLNTAQATAAKIKLPTNPALTYQNTVPAEDGSTLTLHASNNLAATFTTGTSGTVYALVYTKTAATYSTDGGKNDYTSETFNAAGTLYTDAACTTKATSFTSGTTYYKRTGVTNKGEYAIKIVRTE